MFGATPQDSSCSTHGCSHAEYGISSSVPYVPRPADSEEVDERGDDDGDGGDDDQDKGDDDADEEQTVYVAPVAPASGSDKRPRHEKGKGLTGIFMSVMSKIVGSRNKRPEVARDVPAPTQKRKKVKASDWEQTGAAKGALTGGLGFNTSELHVVATSRQTSQSHQAWIYLYLPMFAPPFRHSSEGCKPYIQMFPTIGYKNENKLLDIRLRLDMMTADEVRWIPYRTQDIRDCWVSTWYGFIAYFDCVEPYMPEQPQEARRPPNNKMYVLRNTFVEALWLEAPSHLLTESWTSVLAIPASSCTDDYMGWYIPCTDPMIPNPRNIPSGYNVPVAPAIPPKALLDLIARECHIQGIDGDEFRRTVQDLLRKHYIAI
ncbi:hypothetical protein M9H77_27087 [Catharanthus roseus]|uniref:Uncharacterized protein n=1 Tax=Catharanthus roseus TaxID=4058 RepID=A0ACC0ACD6_CATRO|nr:hypothetical protein M9H77_27087 [Catharanthus roseus]